MGCVCRPQTNLHPKSLVQHIHKEGKVFSIVFSLKEICMSLGMYQVPEK